MTQGIEQKTVFSVPAIQDTYKVDKMPEDVQRAAEAVAAKTVDVRKLRWVSQAGYGQYVGLTKLATEKFADVAPKCDPVSCRQRMELMMSDVQSRSMVLDVFCPKAEFDTPEAAEAQQSMCEANHEAVKSAFATFAVQAAEELESADAQLADANTQVTLAQQRVNQIIF